LTVITVETISIYITLFFFLSHTNLV